MTWVSIDDSDVEVNYLHLHVVDDVIRRQGRCDFVEVEQNDIPWTIVVMIYTGVHYENLSNDDLLGDGGSYFVRESVRLDTAHSLASQVFDEDERDNSFPFLTTQSYMGIDFHGETAIVDGCYLYGRQ